ncbi:MAG: hypothetical protein H7X97_14440, partial [Opitutaceae bacterium]|nr:hypothetical protein [Verrucomicrobiales bacterium]
VGGGYLLGAITNAAVFLRDDDQTNYPSLFSDFFETDTSASWTKRVGALNAVDDSYAVFNYDYKSINPETGGDNILPSPFSTNFPPRGLKVSFNKVFNPSGGATGDGVDAAGGVNFYANGQNFGGNYAVRFSLFMSVAASATTEHALFGINHSGTKTNWVSQTADPQGQSRGGDGIFFGVVNDASTGTGPNYAVYVSTNQAAPPSTNQQRAATTLTRIFPNPPYSPAAGVAGSPGNSAFVGSAENFSWVDVEITQIGRVISLRMNNEPIFSYTNSTAFTNGTIMLGYNDQFGSSGTPEGFAVYDDVRVLRLPPSVSILATDSVAAEPGGVVNNGQIQIFLSQASPVDLTVPITVSGTAVNGTDYVSVPTSVTIPAGATFTNIAIVPLTDALAESAETVILTVGAGADYLRSAPLSATNTITDSTYVSITATDASAAEPGTNFNTGQIQIALTPVSPTSLTISYTAGGTAINGIDYATIPTSITVPAGIATTNITIGPLSDNLVEVAETVILTLQAGANYGLGSASAATNTIADTTPVRPNVSSFAFGTSSNRFLLSGGIGDNTNQFVLESSPVVNGPYNADTTALVEFLSNGFFRITTTNLPVNTNIFYRIKR